MRLDLTDTIVAIASPLGGAERGVVRVSGPAAMEVVRSACPALRVHSKAPRVFPQQLFTLSLAERRHELPCDLWIWPTPRSYTQQPTVEIHTIGSPPILEALVAECCRHGARLAEPGEFTLRAVLAGRMDLVQAEGVLGVIDAQHDDALKQALAQLAGNVSAPLHTLREELLMLLAELEAGLDFVEEEDVRFIEPEVLAARLSAAEAKLQATVAQLHTRNIAQRLPRVVIAGPPNVGKSSLFNALVAKCGGVGTTALVADQAGTTRDRLTAVIRHAGQEWELVDTAGADESAPVSKIDALARGEAALARAHADVVLDCGAEELSPSAIVIRLHTKSDLAPPSPASRRLRLSAHTGAGLDELLARIAHALATDLTPTGMTAATAARCAESLSSALASLHAARGLALSAGREDLLAAELRGVLDHLGRVVGAVVTDDILDRIFSKFCIGK